MPDVPRQYDRDGSVADLENQGIVVADLLPLLLRRLRLPHADSDTGLSKTVAALQNSPRRTRSSSRRGEQSQLWGTRNRHTLPDLARSERLGNRHGPSDVVGMGVRDRHEAYTHGPDNGSGARRQRSHPL